MSSNPTTTGGFRGFADFAKHTDFATSSGSTTAAATLAARKKAQSKKSNNKQQQMIDGGGGDGKKSAPTSGNNNNQGLLRPSPIYTGSDPRLIVLFRKIGQKRDPITKVRALEELISVVYPVEVPTTTTSSSGVVAEADTTSRSSSSSLSGGGGGTGGGDNNNNSPPPPTAPFKLSFSRKEKIAALCHLIYLHETKLGYDNNSSVRSASYKAMTAAKCHVPKAWMTLFLNNDGNDNDDDASNSGGAGVGGGGGSDKDLVVDKDRLRMAVGMAWGASRGDPAAEVARNAAAFINELILASSTAGGGGGGNDDKRSTTSSAASTTMQTKNPGRAIQLATCHYSKIILGCKRPSSLQEVINPTSFSSSSSSGGNASSGGGGGTGKGSGKKKKSKQQQSNQAGAGTTSSSATTAATAAISESEREEMEERYERVILSVLSGLGWLLECCCSSSSPNGDEANSSNNSNNNMTSSMMMLLFPEASSIFRLLTSSRGSFRRGTYTCVGKMCVFAPLLVVASAAASPPSTSADDDDDGNNATTSNNVPSPLLGNLIPNVLTSEKDPSNFGPLFEMILSYLAAACKNNTANDDNSNGASSAAWDTSIMDPTLFTKSLCKVLRRGCCGAPAGVWGPTILPIVASLPTGGKSSSWKKEDGQQQPQQQQQQQQDDDGDDNDDEGKMMKKEEQPLPLLVVSSLWEGRKSTAGSTDTIAIVSAVAECATFLMLRRPKDSSPSSRYPIFSTQSWKSCGQLFLDSLSYYLMESPGNVGYGPVAMAVDELCMTLSRDLHKLDVASSSSLAEVDDACDGRGITTIKSWLWGEEGLQRTLSLSNENENSIIRKWDVLLEKLLSPSSSSERLSNLIPACKTLFHSIADKLSDRSNKTCRADEGSLLLSIIRFCGVANVFPIIREGKTEEGEAGIMLSASIERFCVNDLLRWILVHASSMSTSSSVKTDFEILKLCIHSIPSSHRQKQIWETMLQELIKSHCDYTTLSVGLTTLAGGSKTNCPDLVRCEVLDSFAIDTADRVMGAFRRSHDILRHHDESDEEESSSPVVKRRRGNASVFLNTCVGISKNCSLERGSVLVSTSVIRHWIHLCCERSVVGGAKLEDNLILEDESGTNALLKTLLVLASSSHEMTVISHDEKVKLIHESWLEGGKTWKECAVTLFDSTKPETNEAITLKEQAISIASAALCDDIRSEPPSDHALLELICQAWAKRAARLIEISPSKGLDLVGLSNIELWDKAVLSGGGNESEFFFLCLMYLLHSTESDEHRRELLFKNSGTELFVHIQTCISKSNDALLESFQSRTARNRQLMETLGGHDGLAESLLEDCCICNIDLLSSLMKDEIPSHGNLRKALSSLSFLVSVLFPSARHDQNSSENQDMSDVVIPADVKEGDCLWYEQGEERKRVEATVVKIHTDDFPNLYFTIKEKGSNNGERQTVAARLKKNPKSRDPREILSTDRGDSAQRDRVGRCIVDKLIKPFLSDLRFDDDATRAKNEMAAESMNIVISQCGLVSLGIGSVRYDVFQLVSSMETDLCDSLSTSEPSLAKCIPLLRCLSLAMGCGVYTIPSHDNVSVLKMDPSGSINNLLVLYADGPWKVAQSTDPMGSFHRNVITWLAAAASGIKDGETFSRISAMMHYLSDIILPHNSCDLATNSLSVMNAASSLQVASDRCLDYSSVDNEDEKSVISKLTDCFVNLSLDGSSGLWIESFSSLLQLNYQKTPVMFLLAAKTFTNELCGCLFDPVKRWCAFQLLRIFAKDSQPLQQGDGVMIPSETENQLSIWMETLEEEEAIELEEDVSVATLWLPQHTMALLQNIGNNSTSSHSDLDPQVRLMGNLLSWIVSLDILDVAGSIDMRNRSHISSFIQKTNAFGCMMNLALQEADLDIGRSENIFVCIGLDGKSNFLIQKVATLAVFRTVESLPTLVKTWYNDDCPRYLRQKLSTFVENTVAPATLQRELVRIKDATSFGEMTVSGSCVSREVVATYQQDECQLSVMIRMPSTFPLRNVEVDCQKTMGIAENRWRRWALQIMLMLNNQDGSVLDALLLWKQNVDKEFDGVEPCPVCYSVLCIKTHRMPNLECKTCHNRFHTSCLYKWFQSSGKSQCVLCQQPWSGSKV